MLTLIKVKVKLQPTVNCGDKISTILFKQRVCRRENTQAADTISTPQNGETHGKANPGEEHACLHLSSFCSFVCIDNLSIAQYAESTKEQS